MKRSEERYRFNRKGDVVADHRTMTTAYLAPDDSQYKKGDALFAPRRCSPARANHPSRVNRKAQAADAMRLIAQAGTPGADGIEVLRNAAHGAA